MPTESRTDNIWEDEDKNDAAIDHIEVKDPKAELSSLENRERDEKLLVRLLDMRLLPTVILIYLMNYIDRNAVTAARIEGLQDDLHLTDVQYSTVLAVLYVTYVPAQIPSNMILNKISRPSYYIPGCVILWGLTSALTGVTKDYSGILATRIFIGLPEAAFYPGTIYLLSCWYTRKELAFRSAILFGGLLVSNALGSLIAAGILSGMEGARGIRAWRWLFYIEGSLTICVGFLAIWALPDYPHNTRWLSPAQRRLAQIRLSEDAGEADEDLGQESMFTGLIQALKDIKVPIFALMSCAQLLGMSFQNFFPTLTSTLGFNTTISLLLAAPPWIFATIICCLNEWHADRTGERFFHISTWWLVVILGFIIATTTMSVAGRYVAMFLMGCGFAGFAITLVWLSNAVPRPPAKRSAAIALVNGLGNLGNLYVYHHIFTSRSNGEDSIGSYAWKSTWGPNYHPSMFIGIGSLVFAWVLALIMRCILVKENQDLDRKELLDISVARRKRIEEAARLEGITFEQALEKRKGFRYLY
ncbi:hypothetical protein QCA50_007503 [Cerrena zonata]|uniref:Major facilitator superfamily (MFS) profile domain-containing protein n=1 Tax=Cerrena zonata TaxID=2478898 RepID=A0AAW0GB08_9APHY